MVIHDYDVQQSSRIGLSGQRGERQRQSLRLPPGGDDHTHGQRWRPRSQLGWGKSSPVVPEDPCGNLFGASTVGNPIRPRL
ncbi:hypothetical protein GCM10009799_16060 [Nocardiopsis rhodophaea]|uniref:Uncharacterized protein n=1 Tax=Nocardiopsis rhodophaea TaxID=280238 RepID=A0ABN2SQP8_9ACTN